MVGAVGQAGVGVESAGRWHHVHHRAADRLFLPTRVGPAVGGRPPPAQTHETHDRGPEPGAQAGDAGQSAPILVGGEGIGPRCRPLHQVGHPDAVVTQCMARIAVDRDESGLERRGPEPVAGAGEPDPDLG